MVGKPRKQLPLFRVCREIPDVRAILGVGLKLLKARSQLVHRNAPAKISGTIARTWDNAMISSVPTNQCTPRGGRDAVTYVKEGTWRATASRPIAIRAERLPRSDKLHFELHWPGGQGAPHIC